MHGETVKFRMTAFYQNFLEFYM